jgi:hypothetical protein
MSGNLISFNDVMRKFGLIGKWNIKQNLHITSLKAEQIPTYGWS